nr:YqiA/YcfP family alpha/beta fold hydrolase [uncultured Glaciecola sp.]
MDHIIYLHGFLSSPKSDKARLVAEYVARNYPNIKLHVPTLPGNPSEAVEVVEDLIRTILSNKAPNKDTPNNALRFIGSSMGGFMSTYFVETYGGKAVLVNPAIEPFKLLNDYFGEHTNTYTGEVFTIDKNSVIQLLQLNKNTKRNDPNYLVYLQKEDETLDYHLAEMKYGSDSCIVEEGGNHSFVGLDKYLSDIIRFLWHQ